MAVEARNSQIVTEQAILQQQASVRVSQIVAENAILQQPNARVSQIVIEVAILPGKGPNPSPTPGTQSSSGLGCIPKCVPYCPVDVATLKRAERGGDPVILAGLLAALAVLED